MKSVCRGFGGEICVGVWGYNLDCVWGVECYIMA